MVITSPERMAARSTTFLSSRTLPGHLRRVERLVDASGRCCFGLRPFSLQNARDERVGEQRDVLAALAQRRALASETRRAGRRGPRGSCPSATASRQVLVGGGEHAHVDVDHVLAADADRPRRSAARAAPWPARSGPCRRSRRGTACRRGPARRSRACGACAPVNAPRSWPKSSLSMSSRGMAAQLTLTNGASLRGLRRWMARLTSSLPVPLSPVMSTLALVGATLSMSLIEPLHRRARADHLVAGLELARASARRCGSGARCWMHVLDADQHALAVQRLLEEVARAELDGVHRVVHRGVAADDDHRQVAGRFVVRGAARAPRGRSCPGSFRSKIARSTGLLAACASISSACSRALGLDARGSLRPRAPSPACGGCSSRRRRRARWERRRSSVRSVWHEPGWAP